MGATGTATLDFGSTPGGNVATTTIAGQAGIVSGSLVEAFIMGDSTADHNVAEHELVPMRLRCGNIVAATGFDVTAITDLRLTGTFSVRWVWD